MQGLFLKFIRGIGRVYRFEAGNPELAEIVLARVFRQFAGNHGGIALDINPPFFVSDIAVAQERVAFNPRLLDEKKPVMIGHPLSGQEDLVGQHAGLTFGLFDDQLVLEGRGAVKSQPETGDYDDADQNRQLGSQPH